jgi:hypothetical protein
MALIYVTNMVPVKELTNNTSSRRPGSDPRPVHEAILDNKVPMG